MRAVYTELSYPIFFEIGFDNVIRNKLSARRLCHAFAYACSLVIREAIDAEMLRLNIDDRLHQFLLCRFGRVGNAVEDVFRDFIHANTLTRIAFVKQPLTVPSA